MRIFLIVLLSLILIPLLIVTTALGIVNLMLTESFVVSTLHEVDLYGKLETMVPQLIAESFEANDSDEANPMQFLAPRLNFGYFMQEASESLVGKVFNYLNGNAQSVELSLDLRPVKTQIEAMILDKDTFIEIMLEVNPEEADQLFHLSEAELAQVQQDALAGFQEGADIPDEMNFDFITMLGTDDPNFPDVLETIRVAFSHMRNALWIAFGVCLLLVSLMLLLSLAGGLTATGICLLIIGGPLAVTSIAMSSSFSSLLALAGTDIPAEAIGIIEPLLSQIFSVPRNIGLGYTIAAIILIILAVVARKVKKRKLNKQATMQNVAQQTPEPTETLADQPESPEKIDIPQ